jgi:DNA mismatch repair protein MutL
MGFGIAEFGGDNFVLDALPSILSETSGSALLESIALEIEEVGARTGKEDAIREIIAKSACKTAVKAHDKLSVREIEQLVIDLAAANMPYTCPHGRPTLIFMSIHELNKKFGRE